VVSALLWGEGTLGGRNGRGVAIGLELDAIPLHVNILEARLILRMAHSGEEKGGVGGCFAPVLDRITHKLGPPEA